MLKSLFKLSLRTLWKEKIYTLLNTLGLTVGISASLLIYLWVQDEFRVNQTQNDSERIFRVKENRFTDNQDVQTTNATSGLLKDALKSGYPEVATAVQFTWEEELLFTYEGVGLKEHGRFSSPEFFSIFSFNLVEGDVGQLANPKAIFISEEFSKKLFDSHNGLGETLNVIGYGDFQVAGILETIPMHSELQLDFILPIKRFLESNNWLKEWDNNGVETYVKLIEGANPDVLGEKIKRLVKENASDSNVELVIQNIGREYLYGDFENGKEAGGRIDYVYLFVAIGSFILIIALVNFMNLSTARSIKRAKEVGVKKVLGSSRSWLIAQFLIDALNITLISSFIAGVVVRLLLPLFNAFTAKSMIFSGLSLENNLILLGIALMVAFLAGIYPALLLSSSDSLAALKGRSKTSKRGTLIRRGLVVFQFTISISLIIGTLVIQHQIEFIGAKKLGFDKESLIYIPLQGELVENQELFRNRMLENPQVTNASSVFLPFHQSNGTTGGFSWEGMGQHQIRVRIMIGGPDFMETMGFEMIEGRIFSSSLQTDNTNIIVNETAAKMIGLESPLNLKVNFWGQASTIIGVVKDFHFESLHKKIEPLIIGLKPSMSQQILIRTNGEATGKLLEYIESVSAEINPGFPVEYNFVDSSYERLYQSENKVGTLSKNFAMIAVFVSLLGLFGLASFAAEQRIKEIGIRKVLGAGIANLVLLLAKNFLLLVFIGFGVAVPVSYYVMTDWLTAFEYKVTIGVSVFLIAGGASVLIALATVSYHSIRAASANPVKSLRYE